MLPCNLPIPGPMPLAITFASLPIGPPFRHKENGSYNFGLLLIGLLLKVRLAIVLIKFSSFLQRGLYEYWTGEDND